MNRFYSRERLPPRFAELLGAVQRNCDISDARHAGDYGLCTFLLKMREYYRWETEAPFASALSRQALGEWLDGRERLWSGLEEAPFEPLPLGRSGLDAFAAAAANRALLPRGLVYGAGYGRLAKPVFFLGRLLRVEERAGLRVVVSSCEYARELAAPPAMLLGRAVFVRRESVRRYLWERLEEWRWRKLDLPASRALEGCDFETDTERALERLADRETETMVLHEVGEARAGRLLGAGWGEMMAGLSRSPAEPVARAVRDLLADCLSTWPALAEREDPGALHFHFATFDAPRRQLFPQALEAYERFLHRGDRDALRRVIAEGSRRWLETARGWLALDAGERPQAIAALAGAGALNPARERPAPPGPPAST